MSIRQGLIVSGTVPYEEALSVAVEYEFDYVELDMEQAFPPGQIDPGEVGRAASDRDLDVVVHLPYKLDPGSPHEEVREGACRTLERAIDAAVEMGARKGVIHAKSSVRGHTWGPEHMRECLYESVDRLVEYGRERSFEVVVENLKEDFFDAGDFPELLARTDARLCLDTGHAAVSGQDGAWQASFLESYGDRVSHVHLNDTRRDDDDEHLPVGMGTVDFEAIADGLEGWSGTCTHELFGFDLSYAGHGKRAFERLIAE